MYRPISKKENYDHLIQSGMFEEFYPELTGSWEEDLPIISEDVEIGLTSNKLELSDADLKRWIEEIKEASFNLIHIENSDTPKDIVEELNWEFYDNYPESISPFTYESNGISEAVIFKGEVIWNSDFEERSFISDIDDYEPLKPYLISKVKEIVSELYNVYGII